MKRLLCGVAVMGLLLGISSNANAQGVYFGYGGPSFGATYYSSPYVYPSYGGYAGYGGYGGYGGYYSAPVYRSYPAYGYGGGYYGGGWGGGYYGGYRGGYGYGHHHHHHGHRW